MNRRGLHGLFGALILAGLLAFGLAFTFAAPAEPPRSSTWVTVP